MKSIITTIGLFITCSFFVGAQFAMTFETHALRAGDNHHFIIADNNLSEGVAGSNVTWDFSALTSNSDLTSHMLKASDTPAGKDIEDANTVIQEWESKFYFKVSKDKVEEFGVAACGNSIIEYDEPFVKMVFPFRYGDVYEGTFSGNSTNASSQTPILGSYRLELDAYGTLILPNGTVKNVVRLKEIRSEAFGNCGGVNNITYRWYCKKVRYPLLTVIESVNGDKTQIVRVAYYGDLEKNLKSTDEESSDLLMNEEITLSTQPNPYSTSFTLNYNLPKSAQVRIDIIDNTGKLVNTLVNTSQESGAYSYEVLAAEKGMQPGLYYLKILVNEQLLNYKVIQIK